MRITKLNLDEIDRKLLALLTDDARMNIKDLARHVSRSRAVIYDRISKLKRNGYIERFTIVPSKGIKLAQAEVKAYLLITLEGPICKTIVPQIRHIQQIKQCKSISGMIDMMLYVEAESMDEIAVIRAQIEAVKGVKEIKTLPVLMEHFDRLFQEI
ncbi:MAG: Lrp/AsnC family transcriptional regulator [Alphaproteobacteria bacterium]